MEGHIWKFVFPLVVLFIKNSASIAMTDMKGNNRSGNTSKFSGTEDRGDSSLTVKEPTYERATSRDTCWTSYVQILDLAAEVNDIETSIKNINTECVKKESNEILSAKLEELTVKIQSLTDVTNEEFVSTKFAELQMQMQEITSRLAHLESGLSTPIIRADTEASRKENGFETVTEKLSTIVGAVNSMKDDLAKVVEHTLQCKDGWVKFEGSCYYFSTERPIWQTARDHCRYQRSDLVKVTSDSEFQFIEDHIKESTWTGLNDIEEEGVYRWSVDNTIAVNIPTKRSWWHSTQPDDNLGDEDCIHFWFQSNLTLWNDIPCSYHYRFVCEKKLE